MKKVELTNTPELILNYDILNKIQYLCNRIDKVEWSGILFYSTEGSVKDPDSLKLIAKDIYLMDKGSAAYTEYETNSSLIKYIMDNKLQELQRAHIHSHNSMDTFFSSTDIEELHDNSEFYNYYLSLIVNNAGKMTAKIAMRGKYKVKSNSILTYFNEDGKEIKTENIEEKDENVLFILDCEIVKGTKISDGFKKLVEETIEKVKKEKENKDNQFGLDFENNREVNAEELLVNLLWDDDDTNLDLSETLKDLNKQFKSKEDRKEYIEEVKNNMNYYFSGYYEKERKKILKDQMDLVKIYNYSIAKDIHKMLKEEFEGFFIEETEEKSTIQSSVYDKYNQYNQYNY